MKTTRSQQTVVAALFLLVTVISVTAEAKPRRRRPAAPAVADATVSHGPRKSVSVIPARQVVWAIPALDQLTLAAFESSPHFHAVQNPRGNTASNADTLAGSAHYTRAQLTCQAIVTDVRRSGGRGASFNLGSISGLGGYNIRVGANRYQWYAQVRLLVFDARSGSLLSDRTAHANVQDRGVYVDVGFDRFAANKLSGWGLSFDRMRRTSLGQAVQQAVGHAIDDLASELANHPWEARVATTEAEMVYLNVGRGSGLKNGDLLQVIRDSKIVTDPVTGEVLERETVAIAQLKVVQVRDKVTTARLVDEQQLVELVRGDVVQLLPKP